MTTFAPSVTSTATGVAPCAALAKSTFVSGGCVAGGDVAELVQPASAPMTNAAVAQDAAAELRGLMAGEWQQAACVAARFRCG